MLVLCLLPLLALSGCGIDDSGPAQAGGPASGMPERAGRASTATHVYFYSATGLERVSRLTGDPDRPQDALDLLVRGPDAAERARGLVSFLPDGLPAPDLGPYGRGTVEVTVPAGWSPGRAALRQLVCTTADAVGTARDQRPADIRVRVRRLPGGEPATTRCTTP